MLLTSDSYLFSIFALKRTGLYNFFHCVNVGKCIFRAQNEIYRLQSRVDTLEADRNRLEIEAERAALAAAKAREDLRKLHDESTR